MGYRIAIMIKSMTGYGRAQDTVGSYNVTVELKSVNHRYFEFSSRVPRSYGFIEDKLKNLIGSLVSRGKIECYVSIENIGETESEVVLNEKLAEEYLKAYNTLEDKFDLGVKDSYIFNALAKNSDLFSVRKKAVDEDEVWESVSAVAKTAVEKFISMRENEGVKLREDVMSRADFILSKVAFIEQRSPETVKEYNAKLLDRLKEFLSDIHVDEQRIATECAIFADKVAVAEETVRLRSHIDQLSEFMGADEPIGRKIDFLVQEMNREANTIGSKAQDVEIARCVIDIKAEIEKIREQIQNIE